MTLTTAASKRSMFPQYQVQLMTFEISLGIQHFAISFDDDLSIRQPLVLSLFPEHPPSWWQTFRLCLGITGESSRLCPSMSIVMLDSSLILEADRLLRLLSRRNLSLTDFHKGPLLLPLELLFSSDFSNLLPLLRQNWPLVPSLRCLFRSKLSTLGSSLPRDLLNIKRKRDQIFLPCLLVVSFEWAHM